ncbi:MAG TPA: MFS transporter [Chloroflexota bacterium]
MVGRESLGVLLRNRPFVFYLGTTATSSVGGAMLNAALAWQVYDMTGSPLPLGFLGVARFVPNFVLSFIGGALADTRDRRVIVGISQLVPLAVAAVLGILTATETITLGAIYFSSAITGIAAAFQGPAQTALLPQIVPPTSFQRSVTLNTMVRKLSGVFGPFVAGLILAIAGVAPAYFGRMALMLLGLVFLASIRVDASTNPRAQLSLKLIKEGLDFMWGHRPVLGAMTLDLLAETFGSAEALLPIYAKDVLGVGAVGFGLLNSARAVGGLAMSAVLTAIPPVVSSGRVLVLTVVCFGLATVAFGLSTWFPLSLVLYALIAAIDQVSVVLRQNIIQLGTPDALRGRVNSVNQVFVGSSGYLGEMESGVVAAWTGSAQFAVVSGGFGCLAAAVLLAALIPSLWRYRLALQTPRAEEPITPQPL